MHFEKSFFCLTCEFIRGSLVFDCPNIQEPFKVISGLQNFDIPPLYSRHIGRKKFDLVPTTYPPIEFLSKNFKNLLEKEKATGWKPLPIVIEDPEVETSDYFLLTVPGRCGPIINEMSKKVKRPPRFSGGNEYEAYMGLYFAPGTWDGSDVFLAEGTGYIFVTERIAQAIKEAKLTNVRLIPQEEMERTML